nr:helix-turn-helix transcriptional regulator [Methylobacterium sp. J-048]
MHVEPVRCQVPDRRVADEEHPLIGAACAVCADRGVQHRLRRPGLHLHEAALAGRRLLDDEVDVGLASAERGHPLPARARHQQIGQHLEVRPVQPGDQRLGGLDHLRPYRPRPDDGRLVDVVNPPQEIVLRGDLADRALVPLELGQAAAQARGRQRRAEQVEVAPSRPRPALDHALSAHRYTRDLRLGERPPQPALREGDPERIGRQGVEVPEFAQHLADLARRVAPVARERGAGAIPVAGEAFGVRFVRAAEADHALGQTGFRPGAAGPELDVPHRAGGERRHGDGGGWDGNVQGHGASARCGGRSSGVQASLCRGGQSSEISVYWISDFWIGRCRRYWACRTPSARPAMPPSLRSRRHRRLAELIARYRDAAGLKQSDVAKQLGRHQPFVSGIESGQRRVDLVELLDLAEVIGFDPHELLKELNDTPRE